MIPRVDPGSGSGSGSVFRGVEHVHSPTCSCPRHLCPLCQSVPDQSLLCQWMRVGKYAICSRCHLPAQPGVSQGASWAADLMHSPAQAQGTSGHSASRYLAWPAPSLPMDGGEACHARAICSRCHLPAQPAGFPMGFQPHPVTCLCLRQLCADSAGLSLVPAECSLLPWPMGASCAPSACQLPMPPACPTRG